MALKPSILCFTIIVILGNPILVSPLELSEPLGRIQAALLSDNPAAELSSLISEILSRENVLLLLRDVALTSTDLPDRLANEDLLNDAVNTYVENPNSGIYQLQRSAAADIPAVLSVFNSELGAAVLSVSNDSVVINVDALEEVVLAYSRVVIKQRYSNNVFLQIVLTQAVKQQIQLATAELEPLLANVTIPLEAITDIVSLANSNRSKRDLGGALSTLIQLIRSFLSIFLSPIQAFINTILNNIISGILFFYVPEQPSNIVAALLVRVTNLIAIRSAEAVVIVQNNLNIIFNNIIRGPTRSSRRRRDVIDLEFEDFYDFSRIDHEISHRRVTRSANLLGDIIGGVGGFLVGLGPYLNTLAKNIFIDFFSSKYEAIGKFVTIPLRILVNWLINTVIPCSTCPSIV